MRRIFQFEEILSKYAYFPYPRSAVIMKPLWTFSLFPLKKEEIRSFTAFTWAFLLRRNRSPNIIRDRASATLSAECPTLSALQALKNFTWLSTALLPNRSSSKVTKTWEFENICHGCLWIRRCQSQSNMELGCAEQSNQTFCEVLFQCSRTAENFH